MKLALVRARYNPFGGAERFLNDAVAALASSTPPVEMTLFTRAWPKGASGGAMAHHILNPRHLTSTQRDRGFARAVRGALAREHFDLVQSYERLEGADIYHAVDGVHAEWLQQRRRIQGAVGRFGVAFNPHHRWVLAAERAMYTSPRFKAAICISEMVKQDILRHFDLDPTRLHVIYSGVDTTRFAPDASLRETTRAAAGVPQEVPVALFVGSGFARKGLACFLQALAAAGKDWHGVVVGKDKRLEHYRAVAANLGIGSRVTFTGGIPDPRPWYAASDVFVLPTIYEPFGLVCLEALAAGLPVVTSTAAGAAEVIREGINGSVTDALDVAGIVRAMRSAAGNSAMRDAARASALAFTADAMSARYLALYAALLRR